MTSIFLKEIVWLEIYFIHMILKHIKISFTSKVSYFMNIPEHWNKKLSWVIQPNLGHRIFLFRQHNEHGASELGNGQVAVGQHQIIQHDSSVHYRSCEWISYELHAYPFSESSFYDLRSAIFNCNDRQKWSSKIIVDFTDPCLHHWRFYNIRNPNRVVLCHLWFLLRHIAWAIFRTRDLQMTGSAVPE